MRIYLDNAATTPLAPEVIDVMHSAMNVDFGNPSSVHAIGRKARTLVEDARKTVAGIFRASVGEIYFTSGATESNNTAIIGAVRDLGVKQVITSPTEHPCVLNSLKYVEEQYNVNIQLLRVDELGNPDLQQLDQLLSVSKKKTMVSLMHGNNEIGTVLDIDQCSDICGRHQVLFHTDAVQTAGKHDIDLSKLNISFLSATGHKIHGPKGVGMLYVNSDNNIKPLINGGGQERQMRSGTENTYGICGFSKALEILYTDRDTYNSKLEDLHQHFKDLLLEKIDDVQFNGNEDGLYLPHVLSVSVPMSDKSDMLIFNLDINGICASAGSACSSGAVTNSHVMQAIGHPNTRKTIRFSLSPVNTKEEIDIAASKFAESI